MVVWERAVKLPPIGVECFDLFAFACFIFFLRSADRGHEDVFFQNIK